MMKTIKKANENQINIGVTTLLTTDNIEDIDKLIAMVNKHNIFNVSVGRIMMTGRASQTLQEKGQITYEKYVEQFHHLQKKYDNVSGVDLIQRDNTTIPFSMFNCTAGTLLWSIFEDGDIQPCAVHKDEMYSLGTIYGLENSILFNRVKYIEEFKNKVNLHNDTNCPFMHLNY